MQILSDELQFIADMSERLAKLPVEAQRRIVFYMHQTFGGPLVSGVLPNGVSHGVSTSEGGFRGRDRSVQRRNPQREKDSIEVLQFLNAKTGRSYRPVEENLRFIRARLATCSVEDVKGVVARKTREWLNTEMAKYLRPATLFNATRFEQYIGEQRS